jgi:hypothetical protein
MSTWDYSLEPVQRQRYILDWVDEKWANEEFIKSHLPNVTLKIHSTTDSSYIDNHDTNRMIFHWKTLYQMVIKSGKSYDAIFVVRTDSMFFIQPSFFDTTLSETLYVKHITDDNGVADTFFFGYEDTILHFLNECPDKMNNPHDDLYEFLINKFKYKFIGIENTIGTEKVLGFNYRLIRSNMTHMFDFYKNIENQADFIEDEPYILSTDFQEELRYSESLYNPGPAMFLLIGENCIDEFIYGDVERLAPEAPSPVLKPTHSTKTEGMAGNVKNQLSEFMIDVDFLTNKNLITKTRFVDNSSNYMLLRTDSGDESVQAIDIENLPDKNYDFIIISDYDKGFLKDTDIEYIISYYKQKSKNLIDSGLHRRNVTIFIDTKKTLGPWINGVDYIKLNHKEYQKNKTYIDTSEIKDKVIVTRGSHGCDFRGVNYKNKEVNIKDVSGAGDTFLAALVTKYMHSRNIKTSIEFANKISELVVQKKGVCTISIADVLVQKELEKNK